MMHSEITCREETMTHLPRVYFEAEGATTFVVDGLAPEVIPSKECSWEWYSTKPKT